VGSLVLACLRSDATKKKNWGVSKGEKSILARRAEAGGFLPGGEGGKGRHTEIG
jgi:hypothetical protein